MYIDFSILSLELYKHKYLTFAFVYVASTATYPPVSERMVPTSSPSPKLPPQLQPPT